jgi:hypothetical protein
VKAHVLAGAAAAVTLLVACGLLFPTVLEEPVEAGPEGGRAGEGATSCGLACEAGSGDGNADASDATATWDDGAIAPDTGEGATGDAAREEGPAAPGIRCGPSRCVASADVCCEATPFLDGSTCTPSAQCNPPSYTFFCSTTAHCTPAAPYCCGNVQYTAMAVSGQIQGAECSNHCTVGNYGKVTLCDPSDPASLAQCAALDAGCLQLARQPPGYYACQ